MFLLISSFVTLVTLIMFLIYKKKTLFIFLLTLLSLDMFLFFVFVYFAKRGGINGNLNHFFFLSHSIRESFQNMILTIPQLGYLLSIGRFLFPSLALFLSLNITYSNLRWFSRYGFLLFVFPIISLILYYPVIFKHLSYEVQNVVMWFSLIWVVLYSLSAIIIFVADIFLILPGWSQIKYFALNFFGVFLVLVYLLYCFQDGAQIYNFYSYNLPWTLGLSYLHLMMYESLYTYLLGIYGVLAVAGLFSLYLYFSEVVEMNREEIILNNKSQTALPATHIFVHGLKNKLLVEQAYIKKIQRLADQESSEAVSTEVEELLKQNQGTLQHLDDLYRSFKDNKIALQYQSIEVILEESCQFFYVKNPRAPLIEVKVSKPTFIMADSKLLAEALSNLLINGYESMYQLPEEERKIHLGVKVGMFNVAIEIQDEGIGISESDKKTIFYPFTSNKNSSDNWGMGLFFAKKVIKQHFGKIYIDSKPGVGSTFRVILPKKKRGSVSCRTE